MERRRTRSWKRIAGLEIALGLLILAVIFVLAVNRDMKRAEGELLKNVEYMKEQCNDSEIRDLASEAKSLLRVTESVEQICWRLENGEDIQNSDSTDAKELANWAKDCYMDGLILLDDRGNIQNSTDTSGFGCAEVLGMVELDALMDTLSFSEKSYALRVTLEDESHIDMAAVGRKDGKGVVVGYFYTSSVYARTINNSIRAIVSGFTMEMNGTIAISKGNQIMISNNRDLEGTKIEDIRILKRIMERGTGSKMTYARNDNNLLSHYFGLMDKSKDYYIYAFMDEHKVFLTTLPNVLYALVVYIMAVAVVDMLLWRIDKIYQQKEAMAQREYTAALEEKNKQLQEAVVQARKANAAKSNFLSRMSHDMRTPLNGIVGLLKIDEDHFEDQELVKENHKKMQISADHLLSLINDVLQMSKIEDGTVSLTHECIDLNKLFEEIVTIIRGKALEAGISWESEKEKSAVSYPYVYGSPLHLRQIFLNIYGNCIKYNRPGGKVSTRVETLEEHDGICTYRWTISDTGVGMSREFLEHIYEPFVQEKNDARSVYHGIGLGMSIVKELIDQMGGSISIESEPGIGSTFIVAIPFEIAPAPTQHPDENTGKTGDISGLHLMMAEDNELNAQIAETLLEDQGAEVTVVYNGKQAADLFETNPAGTFDAILMDIMMPVMDGLTAARTIRALDRSDAKTIPIIAMTANAFKEDEEKCLEAGMNVHLIKPLDIEKVKQTIEGQVRVHQ